VYLLGLSLAAALLEGLFILLERFPIVLYVRTIEVLAHQYSSSAAW